MGLKVLLDERLRKESGCNSVGLEWKLIHLVGLGQGQIQEKGKSKGKKELGKKELYRGAQPSSLLLCSLSEAHFRMKNTGAAQWNPYLSAANKGNGLLHPFWSE